MAMDDAIRVIPKKRGRPATGRDPLVAVRLPPDLTARMDVLSGPGGRSDFIRQAIEREIKRRGRK